VNLNLIKIKRWRLKPKTLLRLCVNRKLYTSKETLNSVGKPFKRWLQVMCFASNYIKSTKATEFGNIICSLSIFNNRRD